LILTVLRIARLQHQRFGFNVCGEGGEYETLTLDCPAFEHARIVMYVAMQGVRAFLAIG